MKIQKNKVQRKNKLVYLQILKSKLYKKESLEKFKEEIKYDKIKLYFKKIAHVVFEYHVNGRKILFLNFPKDLTKKLNFIVSKTRHFAAENLTNLNAINKLNDVKDNTLTSQFDLALIFYSSYNSSSLKKNFQNMPVIVIGNYSDNVNENLNYKVPGNFKFIENQVGDKLFLCLLKSIFERVNIKKLSNIRKRLKFKLTRKKRKRRNFKISK